jgi:hypothetical protein
LLLKTKFYPSKYRAIYDGLQYNQWRNAGYIPVNRYKTLSGADAFKLPLRPTLVILLVIASVFFSSIGLSVVLVVRWDRHTLCQALVLALAGAAWQCVWLLSVGIIQTFF